MRFLTFFQTAPERSAYPKQLQRCDVGKAFSRTFEAWDVLHSECNDTTDNYLTYASAQEAWTVNQQVKS